MLDGVDLQENIGARQAVLAREVESIPADFCKCLGICAGGGVGNGAHQHLFLEKSLPDSCPSSTHSEINK